MNPDAVVKTGNALFAAGCAISLMFWVGIPLLLLTIGLIYSLFAQ